MSNRRARQLAREKADRQAQRRAQRHQAQRRRTVIISAATAIVVVVAVIVYVGVRGGGDEKAVTAASTPSVGACTYTPGGKAAKKVQLPPSAPVTTAAAVPATLKLNVGTLGLTLDAAEAPCTVNSFISLAQQGFYDKTPCHRLTTSAALKVLQCGDPSGTGQQGPGYSYQDENLTGATYPAGTLAMANSGPDTNGSQFFLVYGDSQLPANYTPFGTITSGLEVLTTLGKIGTADGSQDGPPKSPVTLASVTVDLAASPTAGATSGAPAPSAG